MNTKLYKLIIAALTITAPVMAAETKPHTNESKNQNDTIKPLIKSEKNERSGILKELQKEGRLESVNARSGNDCGAGGFGP